MKNFSLLLLLVTFATCNIFAMFAVVQQNPRAINTTPTNGFATINGKEIRYYVTADKKFLNIDSANELKVCEYSVSSTKPENYTGSFSYKDQRGVERTCHYKTLSTLSKKNMVPVPAAPAKMS